MIEDVKTAPEADLTEEVKALAKANPSLTLELPESIGDLKNLLLEQENQLAQASAKQGFCFLALKEKLPHGEFEAWLEQCGFKTRTVRKKMQVAQLLLSLPESERPKLAGLGQKRLIALARLDSSVLGELLTDTDAVIDLESLSYKEMRDRIRKLELQNADLQVEQETKNLTIRTLNDRASQRRNFNAEYPDYVNVTRDEGNALSTEVALRIDELDRIVTDLSELPGVTDQKMLSLAVTNLQVHLKATAARACQLTKKLSDTFGDLVTELGGEHLLTQAEIEQAIMDRNTMTQEMEQQKRIREDRRENAKPRKPGRPKSK